MEVIADGQTIESLVSTLILVILSAIVALIKMYLDKFLETKKAELLPKIETEKLLLLEKNAMILVESAEQIYGKNVPSDKKLEYVLDILVKKFPGIDIDTIRAVIEASVLMYKNQRASLLEQKMQADKKQNTEVPKDIEK